MLTYVFQGKKTLYPEPLSGIYLIIRDDIVWYVGKANSFPSRINKNHWVIKDLYQKKPEPIKAYLLPVKKSEVYAVETILIQLFHPLYNYKKK